MLVKDENNDIQRLALHNLQMNFKDLRTKLPFGCKFQIINPYCRIAVDGKPVIRVDDPNTIFITESIETKMCRLCFKENCKLRCSRCMKAYYCSKECQLCDYNSLGHKHICN